MFLIFGICQSGELAPAVDLSTASEASEVAPVGH
jgi:hypothetical protein